VSDGPEPDDFAPAEPRTWAMRPIGVVRTPFADKASAPRQSAAARGVAGTIELLPELSHAIDGIEAWSHLWVLFPFHLNDGHWRPKVLPPRSTTKRGVLATRSPHRPNGIGMSVVRLERVDGRRLHVLDVDMVDGTPVFDVKPYVAYTDAVATASDGWLAEGAGPSAPIDPGPRFSVRWSDRAAAQRAFLIEQSGADPTAGVDAVLAAGPEPHPYRRIRREPDGAYRLARKAWRDRFRVENDSIVIEEVASGYRPQELGHGDGPDLVLHRAFVGVFGAGGRA
jgi:tRNA-Thr(GGU) m(6)t(6)A37 methyltransferase TsaA